MRIARAGAAGRILLVFTVGWLTTTPVASGQAIRDLPGFRAARLPPNDDDSTRSVPLGFTLNFFGGIYSQVFVNNNGNITLRGSLKDYVPFGLASTQTPIIAAFFADVDTRAPGSDAVTYGIDAVDGRRAFGVNFFRVGSFDKKADRLNTFQIVLISRPDTGEDNFDIELNYGQITWDVGEPASNKPSVPAVAGYSNGTTQRDASYQLAGSMTNGAFLDSGSRSLARGRLNSTVPGRYVFSVRSGAVRVIQITTMGLSAGTVGQPYASSPLAASGGTAPYAWSATTWPDDIGLTFNPVTGAISGTPTRAGSFPVTVRVADAASTPPATRTFNVVISEGAGARLVPRLLEPREATVATPVDLLVELAANAGDPPIPARDIAVAVLADDQRIALSATADGRYTGRIVFRKAGDVPVTIRATNRTLDRSGQAVVKVFSRFVLSAGAPPEVDFGTIVAGNESCRPLNLQGQQDGVVPFEFRSTRELPTEHTLRLIVGDRAYRRGGPPIAAAAGQPMQLCLAAGWWAAGSAANGEPWMTLVATSCGRKQDLADVRLRWRVQPLTFWQRWRWVLLGLVIALVVIVTVYGYIRPHRFPRGIAITYVPEYEDLDQTAAALGQWTGIGIGFYRDAQAFLRPDFRISGRPRGSLGGLKAAAQGKVILVPTGSTVYCEVGVSEWEEIPPQGRAARLAAIYRFGDQTVLQDPSSSKR